VTVVSSVFFKCSMCIIGVNSTPSLSLTLLLFELVLRQEDGPHQLPDRRLDRHEEFLGVSAEQMEKERIKKERKQELSSSFFERIDGSHRYTVCVCVCVCVLSAARRPHHTALWEDARLNSISPQLEVRRLRRVTEIDAHHSRRRLACWQQLCPRAGSKRQCYNIFINIYINT